MRGLVLAYLPGRAGWQYGDRLLLHGLPVTPPEGEEFSYRDYLARQDIYTYLTYPRVQLVGHDAGSPFLAAIYRLRDCARRRDLPPLPCPRSAPAGWYSCWASTTTYPQPWRMPSSDTGTSHMIAISRV